MAGFTTRTYVPLRIGPTVGHPQGARTGAAYRHLSASDGRLTGDL